MEFLEKIPYLLSLFAPIALFFAFGLWVAWWVWYRYADRLQAAYTTSLKLGEQIEAGREDERDLSARALALISTQKAKWSRVLSDKDSELKGLNNRYGQLKTEADGFQGDLSKRDDELKALKLDLTSRDSEINSLREELKSKQVEQEAQQLQPETQQLSEKSPDTSELEALKVSLRDAEKALAHERESASQQPSGLALFKGESVKEDASLGFVYTSRPSQIDDLKRIKGVANVLEKKLHDFGVYRFKQISIWNEAQIAEFSERLSFPDRIRRDNWKQQAIDFDK